MTLDDAIRLQEKWKANNNGYNCQHNQLLDHLRSPNGNDLNHKVCLICGEMFKDPTQQLSLTEFKTLRELSAKERG